MALLALQVARLGWTIATPVTPLGDWRPAAGPHRGADILSLGSYDPFFRKSAAADPVVSALELTLLGTRVDTVSGRGSAIIATPDGRQSSYLVGEAVLPGVRLQAVAFDNVTLVRGDASESLYLDQSSGTAPVVLDAGLPAVVAPLPATPAGLASEIAATPRIVAGTVNGLVLSPKGAGTAFTAAGLRPGDVLISLEGRPVGEFGDPATFATRLGSGASVVVERNGQPVTLRIGDGQ